MELLAVDDSAAALEAVRASVEPLGAELVTATSGEEALRQAGTGEYDLILLDQRMPPGMSGIEVAEQLRREGESIPIVLYSAYLDADVEERARALGLRTVDKGEPDRLMEAIRLELSPQ